MHLRAAGSRSYPWCARGWLSHSCRIVHAEARARARAGASNPMTVAAARRARLRESGAASCIFGKPRLHSACINPGDRPREKRRVQCPMPREHAPPRREQLRSDPLLHGHDYANFRPLCHPPLFIFFLSFFLFLKIGNKK